MKKIKSKKNFVYGVVSSIFAVACLISISAGFKWRSFAAGIILLVLSAVNYKVAFSHRGIIEETAENTDERDIYIIMKSSRSTIKIFNYVLYTACFVSLILYGFLKSRIYIVTALVLCAVLAALFLIMLFVNIYYDRHI